MACSRRSIHAHAMPRTYVNTTYVLFPSGFTPRSKSRQQPIVPRLTDKVPWVQEWYARSGQNGRFVMARFRPLGGAESCRLTLINHSLAHSASFPWNGMEAFYGKVLNNYLWETMVIRNTFKRWFWKMPFCSFPRILSRLERTQHGQEGDTLGGTVHDRFHS